jgi:hypothetical protein
MSATTIAVAVNHGTPVDGPPDAELGMTDSPPAPQHYTVQPKKIQQAFSTILAPPWCVGPATQERPPAVGAGGRKKTSMARRLAGHPMLRPQVPLEAQRKT